MSLSILWLVFVIVWGVLIKVMLADKGIGSPFWWANTLGHCVFGALWVQTCLDTRWQRIMHGTNNTFFRCVSSLLAVAIIWEFAEYFYDLYLRPAGMMSAQKGSFDTVCDISVAMLAGIIIWRMRKTSEARVGARVL